LTAIAVLINVAIAGVIFRFAGPITKQIGNSGSKAISKIASLLLASIAIMLVRKGVLDVIAAFTKQ
jgi:multiple antibiotic resistance protein